MSAPSRRPLATAPGLTGLACLLTLTGCIHVNLPDHLVADTVDAGKDLYNAIETAVTDAPPRPMVLVHTCIREEGVPVRDVERACVDELVTQTKTQLKLDKLDYAVGDHTVDKVGGSVVVSCTIALKT